MANNNYQATKQELGVGFDYYVIITGGQMNITIGSNPATGGALTTYVEKRSAFIGGTPVIVKVELWTSTPLAIS
jgi:hypothetical protein